MYCKPINRVSQLETLFMAINVGRYKFDGPYQSVDKLDYRSGVYAILDSNRVVIDIGESSSVKTRVANHDRQPCWEKNRVNLVAVLYVPSAKQRLDIEQELRLEFNPVCGVR